MNITPYPLVDHLLTILISKLQACLGRDLVGIYLTGSLVSGDFDPDISDIDLIVVCQSDIDKLNFHTLNELHTDLIAEFPMWKDRLEIIYVARQSLLSFKSQPYQLAVISPGEEFNIKNATNDWLMNWYLLLENNKTLLGPHPNTFIEPITKAEFHAVIKEHALHWREWVSDTKSSRRFQSYAILTICRVLYVLHEGQQTSKNKAAAWMKMQHPQWKPLIDNALAWRFELDDAEKAGESYSEVKRFIDEIVVGEE